MRARLLLLLAATPYWASAHAPVLPPIKGPLEVRGAGIVNSTGDFVLLRGVSMPGLEVPDPLPGSVDAQNVAAMTSPTFGVIRVRWNMNTVRLPVSVARWRRDGRRYLDRVAEVVRLANDADLAVTLAAHEDASGLPSANSLAFWREWAAYFKDNPRVIFSVFDQPSAREIPGAGDVRTVADWQFWLNGGTTVSGQQALGMQDLVDAIRATGAAQLIAVSAFHDREGFRGMASDLLVRGAGVIYEAHPYYDVALSNADREASFGFLASQVPVYAGEWGLQPDGPACLALPQEPQDLTRILFDTLLWFDARQISWTAAAFQPGSLVSDFVDYLPTTLKRPWTCGPAGDPDLGMGEAIVLFTTGDPTGFGALRADQIANLAGGPASPLAPGQLVSIYAEQLGPATRVFASVGEEGKLPTALGGTEVLIDGVAAPILSAGAFQIDVQAPFELVPGTNATMQVFFRGIPSNRASLEVIDAAPELFRDPPTSYAVASNEDGSSNSPGNAAAAGSVVVFFASGCGVSSSPMVTGAPAPSPQPTLALPVAITVQDQSAEVLSTGYVPGFVGRAQIKARLPAGIGLTQPRPARVVLQIGSQRSRSPVLIWIR